MFMKKLFIISALAFALSAVPAFSQEEEKEIKRGWSFGILPCVSYSTDMGFQYGAFGDIYQYGDGSTYPDPLHKISWEVSHYTKGRSRFYLAYDSKYLIPKLRLSGSATYITDPLYFFYGFNGAATYFDDGLSSNKDDGISYYNMRRNLFRGLADVQGVITPSLHWAAGASYWHFTTGDFDSKYGYNQDNTLYNDYVKAGVIKAGEAEGGDRIEFKAGLVYDTRDIEAAPNKGIWAEVYLNGSPDLFGDGYKYLKLCAHFRQYVTIPVGFIKAGDPVFAYHLGYQGTLAGDVPFYMQQNITALILKQMISEGLGSSNSIRGTYANRVIADGYLWGNFELRVKFWSFKLFNQYFYLAANPFFDCGIVTDTYRAEEMAAFKKVSVSEINSDAKEFIKSAGLGLKLAWNQNFILSVELAKNFNDNLGGSVWFSLGTNYIF